MSKDIVLLDMKLLRISAKIDNNIVSFKSVGPLKHATADFLHTLNKNFGEEKLGATRDGKTYLSINLPALEEMRFANLLKARVKRAVHRARTPELVTIAITDRCQCSCDFCSAGSRKKNELSVEVVKNIANDVEMLGGYTLSITGGEPLLHKDIIKIVKAASEKCVTIMFTNGILLDKKMARSLKRAGLQAIWISLDSSSRKEHDKIRGKEGLYDAALKAIESAKDSGLLVGIAATVSKGKVDRIPKILELGDELGVNEVLVWELMPSGSALKDESILLSPDEKEELFNIHKTYNKTEKGPRLSVATYIESAEVLGCCAARRWSHVASTGDLCPCDFIPISFGNLNEERFLTVWKRMTTSTEFKEGVDYCRIQDKKFRKKFIGKMPKKCSLPMHIDELA